MTQKIVLPWPFELGKTVIDNRFLLKNIEGLGGMGLVYRAEDLDFDRHCVLKMLAPKLHPMMVPQHDARGMLIREAKTLAQLSEHSDSFVTVFHRGTAYILHGAQDRAGNARAPVELDLTYYVMELLHGCNLQVLIDSHRQFKAFLSWPAVLKMSIQAVRGLCLIHAKNIVHRDVKPNNLFLHERVDRKPVVKILDFGVSRLAGEPGVIGTATKQYGPPEVLKESGPVPPETKQSDIYSLGLVVYELAGLYGPFSDHSADYVYAHLNVVPPPLTTRRADAPPALVALLEATLAKRPENRPTAVEFMTGLEAIRNSFGVDDAGSDAQISELLSVLRTRATRPKRARVVGQVSAQILTGPSLLSRDGALVTSEVFLAHSVPPMATPLGAQVQLITQPFGAVHTLPFGAAPTVGPVPTTEKSAPPQAYPQLSHDTDPDGEPLFSDFNHQPLPPTTILADEENVPVLTSMSGALDDWQDTVYASSPYSLPSEEEAARRGRPSSGPLVVTHADLAAHPDGSSVPSLSEEPVVVAETPSSERRESHQAGLLAYGAWGALGAAIVIASAALAWRVPPLGPAVQPRLQQAFGSTVPPPASPALTAPSAPSPEDAGPFRLPGPPALQVRSPNHVGADASAPALP